MSKTMLIDADLVREQQRRNKEKRRAKLLDAIVELRDTRKAFVASLSAEQRVLFENFLEAVGDFGGVKHADPYDHDADSSRWVEVACAIDNEEPNADDELDYLVR